METLPLPSTPASPGELLPLYVDAQPQEKPSPNRWKIVLGCLLALVVVGGSLFAYSFIAKPVTQSVQLEPVTIMPIATDQKESIAVVVSATPSPSPAASMKTYTSATEKITFTYPSDWQVIPALVESSAPTADSLSLQSPSGAIKVSWASLVDGLGGGCDNQAPLGDPSACALITILDKKSIPGAPGLVVASGTVTRDGTVYQPWLAVKNQTTTTDRSLGYGTFPGKNNGDQSAILSTAGIYLGGPNYSLSEAQAYFEKSEVQQAKLILMSLSY